MKLREEEFYYQYHQHGGTTIIPTEIFNELYDDATEEIERLKADLHEANDSVTWWQNRFNSEHKQIEDLKEQIEYQDLWRKEYLSRIDKAINELNKLSSLYDDNYTVSDKAKDIINILRGDSNE